MHWLQQAVKAVHAAVNRDAPGSLALVEIHREDIRTLPALLNMLRPAARRCIILCDDLSFEREGEGMMVKYAGIQLSRRPSSVDEETLEYISTLPLPMVLRWREYQELHELFAGSGMEQTAAVNKPVAPVSLARRPIAAARPATPPLAAEEPPPPEPPEDEPPFDPVPARDPPPRPIAPAAAAAAVPSGEVTGKSRAALLREKLAAR